MNRIFDDNVLRKRFFIILCIMVLVNTLSLGFWYYFRIKPTFVYNDNIKKIIQVQELERKYDSLEELSHELKRIEKKYKTKFEVINGDSDELIKANIKNTDFFLFSDVITVSDNVVIVNAYLHKNFGILGMILGLISFQVIIILILMTSTFFATGRTIIKPIRKIVNDIRAYKFGKKPVRTEVNTELDIINNEFVNLVDSLEEEKKEQNRIIASISHDIKTPLTSIMGYSALLSDDNLSSNEVKEYSNKINEKAKHIKNILATFDDYLINYDNKKLKLANVIVKDIVSDLEADYKVELENKGISFSIECKCRNDVVLVDVLKLKRIFSNIISNSIRYVPEDGGTINIFIDSDDKFCRFIVKDNGCGVEKDVLEKIFDPFFTTDQSRKISGLGLSICKEFVELLGGNIKARCEEGFVVEFTIPISYKKKSRKKVTKEK